MAIKGPLRKVIKEFTIEVELTKYHKPYIQLWEELECGHKIRVPTDIYGEYFASRRRCKQCYKSRRQPACEF